MGFLDRLIGAANKVEEARFDLEHAIFDDGRWDRANEVLAQGVPLEGVVTGLHAKLHEETTQVSLRLEWRDPEPRAAGLLMVMSMPDAIRLGATVPLRVLGERAVLDEPLLAEVAGAFATTGVMLKSAPEPGISERSLNFDVLSHLKKWPRERGRIESMDQVSVLGVRTNNWDLRAVLGDGTRVLMKRAGTPTYAHHLMAVGLEAPLAVSPKDRTRAEVDWCQLALDHAGGSWRDDPPPGSMTALARDAAPGPELAMATAAEPPPPPDLGEAIEGVTIERCAEIEANLVKDRVPPGEYDAYASARFEVPAGRYRAIKAAWDGRIRSDWQVGAAFGEAFERHRKALKKRR